MGTLRRRPCPSWTGEITVNQWFNDEIFQGLTFRLNVLDDTMALVQAGKVSTDVVLRLITSFVDEDSYVVWRYFLLERS